MLPLAPILEWLPRVKKIPTFLGKYLKFHALIEGICMGWPVRGKRKTISQWKGTVGAMVHLVVVKGATHLRGISIYLT